MLRTESNQALVSIVVPVSNMAGHTQMLESWLNQLHSRDDIEVIIVHDVQDELTGECLKELISNSNSTKLKYLEVRVQSPGLARNAGQKIAKGEWILFADSDDFLHVRKVISEINRFRESDYDALVFDFDVLDLHLNREKYMSSGYMPAKVGWNPGIWRWAFRRTSLGAIEFSKHKMGEDQLFLMEYLDNRKNILFVPELIYTYVVGNHFQLTQSEKAINELPSLLEAVKSRRKIQDRANSPISEVMYLHLVITTFISALKTSEKKKIVSTLRDLVTNLLSVRIYLLLKSLQKDKR